MKIVSTKKYFIGVTILLLLPLLLSCKLLIWGEKANGNVEYQIKKYANGIRYRGSYTYSVIKFTSNDNKEYELLGPSNVTYPTGKALTVYYNKNNPNDNLMFNFSGIYLSNKGILSVILLILWSGAFFASHVTKADKLEFLNKKKQ